MRGAVWDEMFCYSLKMWYFLASGDCFDFRWLCLGVTHPRPLLRGEILDADFLVGNEWFVVWWVSPLERGSRGVLR